MTTTTAARLDPRIKEVWMAGLLSGEYEQGEGRLRDGDNRYCCLGVLCDVLGCEWTSDGLAHFEAAEPRTNVLPPAAQAATGLTDVGGHPSLPADLTVLNDDVRKTFAEIAAIIDEHL